MNDQKRLKKIKKLFLFDGVGAVLSAFFLGIVLVRYESYFGMPKETLYLLAAIPCVFLVYDLICYKLLKDNWRPFLKIIALANFCYCLLSLYFVIYHWQSLTTLGWVYFILELLLISLLSYYELQLANAKKPFDN